MIIVHWWQARHSQIMWMDLYDLDGDVLYIGLTTDGRTIIRPDYTALDALLADSTWVSPSPKPKQRGK